MKRKLFMLFAVVCVLAALVAAPIMVLASPTAAASDINTMSLASPVVLVGTLALLAIAAVIYRSDLKRFLYLVLTAGRQFRPGIRSHAPISIWLAVTVLALAFAFASGIVALSPPTVLVALAMLMLVCAVADVARCLLWRVRDNAPMFSGRHFSKMTTATVLAIAVALPVIGFVVLATASPPAVLMSVLAFLIVATLTVGSAYMLRIRGHTVEAAHDIKNACSTDTPASARKKMTGQEVRSHAPTLVVFSGATG